MTRLLAFCSTFALLTGCPAAQRIDPVTVLTHGNCGRSVDGVEIVTLDDVAALRPNTRLIGMEPAEKASAHAGMLLLAIGQGIRPTPGYGLAIARPGMLQDGALTLSIAEKRPDPDDVLAQMITQPCLVVAVPDEGVARVIVRTADGTLIGETSI